MAIMILANFRYFTYNKIIY